MLKIRYIEVSFKDSKEETQFLAAIVTAHNPDEAVDIAAETVRMRYSGAHEIKEFEQHVLTPKAAKKLETKMWIGCFPRNIKQ